MTSVYLVWCVWSPSERDLVGVCLAHAAARALAAEHADEYAKTEIEEHEIYETL